MKTERRHELQKNELADVLGKEINAIKPYWKLIVGGVVAVIAVGIGLIAYSQAQKDKQQAAWKPLLAAQSKAMVDKDADVLAKVASDSKGTSVVAIAGLLAADRELAEGIRLLYVNRKEADPHFTKAAETYDHAQQNATSAQTELKVRALIGLASARECLRDVPKAREALEAAQKTAPNTALGKEAARRLQLLNDHEKWYAWFEANPPVSPHDISPLGGKPLVDPAFKLKELSDTPDIPFTNPPDKSAPPPGTETPLGPALPPATQPPEGSAPTDPAKTDAKPADAKPDEAKPAETKPAETKPAEPAPAEKPADEAKPAGDTKPADAPPPATPAPTK